MGEPPGLLIARIKVVASSHRWSLFLHEWLVLLSNRIWTTQNEGVWVCKLTYWEPEMQKSPRAIDTWRQGSAEMTGFSWDPWPGGKCWLATYYAGGGRINHDGMSRRSYQTSVTRRPAPVGSREVFFCARTHYWLLSFLGWQSYVDSCSLPSDESLCRCYFMLKWSREREYFSVDSLWSRHPELFGWSIRTNMTGG